MLPRANRVRIPYQHGFAALQCAQDVRHQSVCCPVTAANHVAGASRGQADAGLLQKGLAVRAADQLCTALAVGVGVVATHGLVFSVAPDPFLVLVALVGGDVDNGLDGARLACRLQHVDRAHHVGCIGFDGLLVGQPHQWLCRHVDDDFRLELVHLGLHSSKVTDVGDAVLHALRYPSNVKQCRVTWWRQRDAAQVRPHGLQPQAQPTSLEAGVTRQQDAFALPELRIGLLHHWHQSHFFQGALPEAHSSSSRCLSRSVSMGCQKP